MKHNSSLKPNPIFYLILAQLLFWTLIPSFIRYVLPIDANEGFVWGQHFQWGYDRNPWLNALLTHYAVLWGGQSGWLVYGLSQIFVCLAYFSVYQLGRKILNPTAGWIAAFSLIGIQYYSIASIDLNDNVIELGLWPLMVYLGFEAWQRDNNRLWGLAGISAGLAMMAKYYSLIPVACLFTFFVWNPSARAVFKKPGIYLCTTVALLICLPHLLWLPKHHWITVTYASSKVHMTDYGWMNHFIYAFQFGATQIGTLCGGILLIFPFLVRQNKNHAQGQLNLIATSTKKQSVDHTVFLLLNTIGPFVITLLISMIFGWKLNTLWGTPLLTFWPLVFMVWLKSKHKRWRLIYTPFRAKVFLSLCATVFGLLIAGYTLSKTHPGSHSSANIPGRTLSRTINHIWTKQYHTPLKYLAGNRYPSGYVAFFTPHPIAVFIDWNSILCGWISTQQLLKYGAVFLEKLPIATSQPSTPSGTRSFIPYHFPENITKAYPHLQTYGVISIPYHRAKNGYPKYRVLVGLLPPQHALKMTYQKEGSLLKNAA